MNCEMMGVSFVRLAISKTDYLVEHINSNDKEPSWDGDIEVYSKAGDVHSKSDLILKVPVQVKGHKAKNLQKKIISFSVEYADLQNYLNMGGTIFLVVYIDESGENHRIYYAELLPFKLKRLFQARKSPKSTRKSIVLKAFPTDKVDVANVFLGFARNMKLQRPAIDAEDISIDEIAQKGGIPELTFGFSCVPQKDITPFDLILKGNVYLYAKMPYGIELPVEHIETVDMTFTTINKVVTVNGKIFYDDYIVVYKKDSIEFCYGRSSKQIIVRGDRSKQKFTFTLAGTLSERIRDEEFIIEALTAKQYEVGGISCPLNEITEEELKAFNITKRKEHLNWMKTVKELLIALDVHTDLDCSIINENDEKNLIVLKEAILDKKSVPLKGIENAFGFFNIANLKILICALKDQDNHFNIYNYNDAPLTVKAKDERDNVYSLPYCLLLKKEVILKACNINFNKLIAKIQQAEQSDILLEHTLFFLLELLRAYDDSMDRRNDVIDVSIELARWLLEFDKTTPKEVLLINYYQALKRKRELNSTELQDLLDIVERNPSNEEIYVGAYLLLDNQVAAMSHYNKIDKKIQEIFCQYPIFRFWKHCDVN